MTNFFIKRFIKNSEDIDNPEVRKRYGVMTGVLGISLNVLLFAVKLLAGILSGAVSVIADALNNLSDAGSSLITAVGFKLSARPASEKHPFGHGRLEYLTGLIMAFVIMLMGTELFKTSIDRIINPSPIEFSVFTAVILCGAILIKLWMFFFNRKLAKKINSSALKVASLDSISDCVATSAVLAGLVIGRFSGVILDGYFGILVSVIIFIAGIRAAKDTVNELLGGKPDPELVNKITETVLSHEGVSGMHDLIVHSYGPGRTMISLHAEVKKDSDIVDVHELIDHIELELKQRYSCEATIHVDPIAVEDEFVGSMREQITGIVKILNADITVHDFRMTVGKTHTNFIFDIVVPYDFKLSDEETARVIMRAVHALNKNYYAVVNIDKPLV